MNNESIGKIIKSPIKNAGLDMRNLKDFVRPPTKSNNANPTAKVIRKT